jgi:hypothetical protein
MTEVVESATRMFLAAYQGKKRMANRE